MTTNIESRVHAVEDDGDSASALDGVVLISLLFSCCLLPLALAGLPLASAWLSSFPAFVSYRPWLAIVALISTVVGCPGSIGPGRAVVQKMNVSVHRVWALKSFSG